MQTVRAVLSRARALRAITRSAPARPRTRRAPRKALSTYRTRTAFFRPARLERGSIIGEQRSSPTRAAAPPTGRAYLGVKLTIPRELGPSRGSLKADLMRCDLCPI